MEASRVWFIAVAAKGARCTRSDVFTKRVGASARFAEWAGCRGSDVAAIGVGAPARPAGYREAKLACKAEVLRNGVGVTECHTSGRASGVSGRVWT